MNKKEAELLALTCKWMYLTGASMQSSSPVPIGLPLNVIINGKLVDNCTEFREY